MEDEEKIVNEPVGLRKQAKEAIMGGRVWRPVACAFVLLCILVWLDEILDIPHLLLGAPSTSINWREAVGETIMVVAVGIFVVSRLIRDVTGRVRAEGKVWQKTEDLVLINSLNSAANRGDSLQEIVRLLSEETKKMLSSDGATTYLLSEDKDYLVMQNLVLPLEMMGRIERLIGIKIPAIKLPLKAGSLYLEMLRTGKPLLINDPATIQRLTTELVETVSLPGKLRKTLQKVMPRIQVLGIQSVIIVPFVAEGEAIGMLGIYSKEPFTESDLHRLEIISGQLNTIIKRKQAEEELRESERRFRDLFESSPDAIFVEDFDGNVLDVNPAACCLHGIERGSLVGKNVLELVPPDEREETARNALKLAKGELNCIEGCSWTGDGRAVPVEIKASRIDYSGKPAVLLHVRDITERVRVEEELRRRSRDLALLNRVSRALLSTLDPDQVLDTILEEVRHLLNVVACSIWLLDPATGELVCRQVTGPESEIVRGWRLLPSEGLAGWVARRGKSLIVPDAQADERHFKGVDQQTGLSLRSILSVPLKVKDNVIGVLQVVDAEVDRFGTTDLTLLEPLATTAALAIENVRLYERARQDAEIKSTLLREINHRVKNNLSAIIGLLYAERRRVELKGQPVYRAIMTDLVSRVRGLATVHNQLSASGWLPLPLSELTAQVIRSSLQTLPPDKRVSVDVHPSSVRVMPDQAHNLALVINELTTNTIRHALPGRDTAHITVRFTLKDGTVLFEFQDDGPGYPEEALRLESCNVGLDLVQNVVRTNLRGELSLRNDRGAVAVIRFRAEAEADRENS